MNIYFKTLSLMLPFLNATMTSAMEMDAEDSLQGLAHMPSEIKQIVLTNLKDRDLLTLSILNHDFSSQARDEHLWHALSHQLGPVDKMHDQTWKQTYYQQKLLHNFINTFLINRQNYSQATSVLSSIDRIEEVLKEAEDRQEDTLKTLYQSLNEFSFGLAPTIIKRSCTHFANGRAMNYQKLEDLLSTMGLITQSMSYNTLLIIAYENHVPVIEVDRNGMYTYISPDDPKILEILTEEAFDTAIRTYISNYEKLFASN